MKRQPLIKGCISSVVSDVIYTPIITLSMILLARKMASSHGGSLPPFIVMYIKSLVISMIVAFVIISIVTPVFIKHFTKGMNGRPDQK